MKKFRYMLDPVCLISCTLYALNRWALPAALKGPFLQYHFDDLFFIPAALPLALWLQRMMHLRETDAMPTPGEVAMHLVVWSFAAEVLGPRLFHQATGDIWDVVAYAAGAVAAIVLWRDT